MASSARKIVIEFLGEDRGLSRMVNDVDSKTSRLGTTLKKVGKVAAFGLAAGVVVAGKAMFDATQAAIEDEKSQALLAQTLKNTAGATDAQVKAAEDWITAQGKALGVTDDELRPALQRMAEATGDVEKAQRLVSVAMDVSAGTGRSLKSVTEAMLRAQNGQVDGLSRYGIATKKANGETMSFDEVVKSMSKTFEGQAQKSANTLEGKMSRLKLMFNEAQETVGAALIPVLADMADMFIKDVVPAVEKAAKWFNENLRPALEKLAKKAREIFEKVRKLVKDNLDDVREIVKNATAFVKALWDRFGDNIERLTKGLWKSVEDIIGGALKVIKGVFKVFAAVLRGDWREAWEGIKDIVRGVWDIIKGLVRASWTILKEIFRAGGAAVKDIFRGMWDAAKDLVRGGADRIVEFVRSIPDRLKNAAGSFGGAGKALINAFVDGMKNAAGIISGIAGNVWDAVRGLLNSAIDKINAALSFEISVPGPNINVNLPDIPHLAGGTRSFRGGWAVLGENGRELAKLPGGTQVFPHGQTESMLRGATDERPIVVQLVLDGQVIQQSLLRRKRLIGGAALGLA